MGQMLHMELYNHLKNKSVWPSSLRKHQLVHDTSATTRPGGPGGPMGPVGPICHGIRGHCVVSARGGIRARW